MGDHLSEYGSVARPDGRLTRLTQRSDKREDEVHPPIDPFLPSLTHSPIDAMCNLDPIVPRGGGKPETYPALLCPVRLEWSGGGGGSETCMQCGGCCMSSPPPPTRRTSERVSHHPNGIQNDPECRRL